MVKLLLYVDDLILIEKNFPWFERAFEVLELFCQEVGMQVNTSKTKVMTFSLKRKKWKFNFIFEGSLLEIVEEYKYLEIYFHNRIIWETCRTKMNKEDGELLSYFRIGVGK